MMAWLWITFALIVGIAVGAYIMATMGDALGGALGGGIMGLGVYPLVRAFQQRRDGR